MVLGIAPLTSTGNDTATGELAVEVLPLPSCPFEFRPQHQAPAPAMAHAEYAACMTVMDVAGGSPGMATLVGVNSVLFEPSTREPQQ